MEISKVFMTPSMGCWPTSTCSTRLSIVEKGVSLPIVLESLVDPLRDSQRREMSPMANHVAEQARYPRRGQTIRAIRRPLDALALHDYTERDHDFGASDSDYFLPQANC